MIQQTLIPYITFADPNISFTESVVRGFSRKGIRYVELGIPFSDPLADGPVIQASHFRALQKNPGLSYTDVFKFVNRLTKELGLSFILMTAVNLVMAYGVEDFFKSANTYNVWGIVIPDLSVEEAAIYIKAAKKYNIHLIFLVSPVCVPHRLKQLVLASSGFVYLISSMGTTGERQVFSGNLPQICAAIKAIKNIPIVVGFGVNHRQQLTDLYQFADGVIVGSYLVRQVQENLSDLKAAEKAVLSSIQALCH